MSSDGERLKDVLSAAAIAGSLGSPVGHAELLRLVVETAARVMQAESAVVLLLDQEGDELVFDVTLGVDVEEVEGLRVPLGQGIAGLVAASGQPMAVSNADGDPRIAPEIADALSYVPRSVLCVPLRYNERVIGALEVLDKHGDTSFDARDIETLGLFAKQAAVAIVQSRTHRSLQSVLANVLAELDDGEAPSAREQTAAVAATLEQSAAFAHARELTDLLVELSAYGDDEVEACLALVRGFAEYVRARPRPGDTIGGFL